MESEIIYSVTEKTRLLWTRSQPVDYVSKAHADANGSYNDNPPNETFN